MPPEIDPSLEGQTETPSSEFVKATDIGNIVNAAVTSHLKRSLGAAIEAAVKPLAEKLQALSVPPPVEEETGKKSKKSESPELVAMAKQLEDMKNALAAEKDRADAAARKSRDDRAVGELRSMLQGKIRDEYLDMLTQHIFTVQGRVKVDDQGNILMKSTRSSPFPGLDPEEVDLPLKAGVEEFLKSDAAKAFLPAPPSTSAAPLPKRSAVQSPRGTDFSKPATSDAEKARRSIEREQMAKQRLNLT